MDLSASAQFWINLLFLWIGFGTVAGLTARALFPGKTPKSAFGTLVIGVMGSCAGPMFVSRVLAPDAFNPISPFGLFASVVAALIFLVLYRMFGAVANRFLKKEKRDPDPEA